MLVTPSYYGSGDYFRQKGSDGILAIHFYRPSYGSLSSGANADTWTMIFGPMHRIDKSLRPDIWDPRVQAVVQGQHVDVSLSEFRRRFPKRR